MTVLSVSVNQFESTTLQGVAREHSITIDRPVEKGGDDKGGLGGEVFLMGLGGCFMSNLLAAARARDIQLVNAKAEVTGEIGDTPARVTDIQISITADVSEPETLNKLVKIAERSCALVVTLKRAVNLSINC